MRIGTKRAITWALAGALALPTVLLPQTGWAAIENITVTTRAQEENLQDIPVSVSAFGAEQIEKQGIKSTADVVKLIPGVQFDQSFSAADTRISIRGINNSRGRASVAVLVDGVDVSGENITAGGGSSLLNTRLLDLERVEVIKGPQAALYGRNAFAGAINYINKQPSMEGVEGTAYVDVSINEGNNYDLRGSISGPIIADKLAMSLNGGTASSDGYYRNNNPYDPEINRDLGGYESNGVRLALLYTPTDTLQITLNTSYTENENDPRPVVKVGKANTFWLNENRLPDGTVNYTDKINNIYTNNGVTNYGQWMGTVGSIDESDIQLSRSMTSRGPFEGSDDHNWLTYIKVEWDLEKVLFKSSSSYLYNRASLHEDIEYQDGLGTPVFDDITDPANDFANPDTWGSFAQDYLDETDTKYGEQQFTIESTDWDRGRWLLGTSAFFEKTENKDWSFAWLNGNFREIENFGRPLSEEVFGFYGGQCLTDFACDYNTSYALGQPAKEITRETDSYSAFGLLGFDITEDLRITAELRYIYDKIKVSTNTTVGRIDQAVLYRELDEKVGLPGIGDCPAITDVNNSCTKRDSALNPRLAIDYRLPFEDYDIMTFASVAKGTKPGGFGTVQSAVPALAQLDQEKLWAYEIGAKTTWLENTLQANIALFYMDYTDRQIGITIPASQTGGFPTSGLTNAGGATSQGVELDLLWVPIDELTLQFGYAYTDAEWDDFNYSKIREDVGGVSAKDKALCGNAEGNCKGADLSGIPENAITFSGNWTAPLDGIFQADGVEWFAELLGQWNDKRALRDAINTPYVDSYWNLDANLGIQTDQFTAQLYVTNLLDDDTVTWGQGIQDFKDGMNAGNGAQPRDESINAFFRDPRVFGLRVNYRFGD